MSEPLAVTRELPPDWNALQPLIDESVREGYAFVQRLRTEWEDGTLRFQLPGETLLGVRRGGELLAVGGLTHDPFADEAGVGRIRRVYVRAAARRQGAARLLVRALMDVARTHFHTVTLRSVTEEASRLYETLGFNRVLHYPNVTHAWSPAIDEPNG